MALRQTATNGSSGNASTLVLTFGASVNAGSLIVLSVNMNSPIALASVTAGSGDSVTYTVNGLGSGQKFYFGHIQNTAGGYTTITLNITGTGWQIEAVAREYTGMLLASVLDQSAGALVSGQTAWTSGSMPTTSQAVDLIVAVSGISNTPATMSAGAGFGNIVAANVETAYTVNMEDQSVISTGAYAGLMTASTPSSGYMAVAAFKVNSMPFAIENVTVTEAVNLVISTRPSVSDSSTLTETVAVNMTRNLSVSDSTTVTETVKQAIAQLVSVSDSVVVSESGVGGTIYTGPAGDRVNVSDSITTAEVTTVGVHPYAQMPLITAENVATSESFKVNLVNVAFKPVLSETVVTDEQYSISTQTIFGWSTINASLFQNNFGPVVNNSGRLTTQGGAGSYLVQQYTCLTHTQYVTQCQIKGIPSTTVTMAAVQNGIVLSSQTITLDSDWDLMAVPAFTTDVTHTTFQIRIYTQAAATINVGAVMTQLGVGSLNTYFDGSTSTSPNYDYTWNGSPYVSTSLATPVGSAVIVADFQDDNGALPVTGVNLPVYNNANLDSSYLTNLNEDSTGITGNAYISLQGVVLNGAEYTMTFVNTYTQPIYITQATLFGTPAKVVYSINQEYKDPTSIALYGTNPANNGLTLAITNDLIQDPSTALSDAYSLVNDFSRPYQRMVAEVFPAYQLQVGDNVNITINDTGQEQTYTVVGTTNGVGNDGGPMQELEVEVKNQVHYFTINQSVIGGTDSIAP